MLEEKRHLRDLIESDVIRTHAIIIRYTSEWICGQLCDNHISEFSKNRNCGTITLWVNSECSPTAAERCNIQTTISIWANGIGFAAYDFSVRQLQKFVEEKQRERFLHLNHQQGIAITLRILLQGTLLGRNSDSYD